MTIVPASYFYTNIYSKTCSKKQTRRPLREQCSMVDDHTALIRSSDSGLNAFCPTLLFFVIHSFSNITHALGNNLVAFILLSNRRL